MSSKWQGFLQLQALFLTVSLHASSAAANVTATNQKSATTGAKPLIVASKNFTEAVILGEVMTQLLNSLGQPAVHKEGLGGTPMLWKALLAGDIDVFGDYTGTIIGETLASLHLGPNVDLAAVLARQGRGFGHPEYLGSGQAPGIAPGLLQRICRSKRWLAYAARPLWPAADQCCRHGA